MVAAIVRYAGPIARRTRAGQIAGAMNTFRRYYPMMREAFRRRRQIRTAASRVQRAFRRYRARPRGNPRVAGQRQRTPRLQTFYNFGGIPDSTQLPWAFPRKTLYTADIQFARVDDQTRKIGEVVGQRIHLKGIKVCLYVQNIAPAADGTRNFIFHFALVQPKGPEQNRPINEKFFVNPGGGFVGDDRFFDFPDVQQNVDFDPRVNCNGINPGRFNIITHRKFKTYAIAGNGPTQMKYVHHEKYYPVNKNFVYKGSDSDDVERPIYACLWYESILDSGVTATVDHNVSLNTVTYFKSIL